MKGYLALIRVNLKLAFREKSVLFFNYFFPLIFFFGLGHFLGGRTGGSAMTRIVSTVIVIGLLGSGLFGAGMRSVMERETGILRRYKVTPITPYPLLIASMITGWLLYLPSVAMIVALSHYLYGMPWPARPFSLFLLITLGSFAFRSIGLIIGSVANSMAESNILIQLLYMPMLFLSGATIPISSMPLSAQIISQFLPASYLNSGVQHIMIRSQGLTTNLESVAALIVSTILAILISRKLFRWEKDEKLPNSSKAWVLAVLAPFVAIGSYQAWSRDHINQAKQLDREIRRNASRLIRGATVIVGDGTVIRNGAVLLKNGKIEEIYTSNVPDPDSINADPVEAAGKTLLPGLIDVHVHLGASGTAIAKPEEYDVKKSMEHAVAAYLYSGVTAVKSTGDFTANALELKRSLNSGLRLGSELFVTGPLFTAPNGHGTEYFKDAPEIVRKQAEEQFTRLPQTADEARRQVDDLHKLGVDGIKAVLEAGFPGMLFQRMDLSVLKGIAEQSRADRLPLVVHTSLPVDVKDALAVGANGIEHGSFRDPIPDELFAEMKRKGVFYDPTLSVVEAFAQLALKKADLLNRPLLQQVARPEVLESTRKMVESNQSVKMRDALAKAPLLLQTGMDNLLRAHKAGVPLVTGTDAGNILVIHGPTVQHEIELWVKAGIPPEAALQAATYNAAKLLGASDRIGLIKKGYEASVILLDGNPLQDISALEHITAVFFKGERVDRQELFNQK